MQPELDLMITTTEAEVPLTWERKYDTTWMLSLYGTAIGAGTLFLPIDAGLSGIWPIVIIGLLAFPMTYYSHQALCRFVLSSSSAKNDITDVVNEYFGKRAGLCLTLLYFFAIFPILLMYSVAITNTTQSFMINQMHITPPPRGLLSLGLLLGLMAIVRVGQDFIIKIMSTLVYPFAATLILFSIYLIPQWNSAIFTQANIASQSHSMLVTLWLVIPVMVFSFNHVAIISSFAVSQKQRFGKMADASSTRIMKGSHLMMVATVMLFVISCVLSLSPQDLALAKQQNISILSYLANHFHTPVLAFVAPLIAFIAISKSFLGHYLGASEGLRGLLSQAFKMNDESKSHVNMSRLIFIVILLSCWLVATLNPNILTMIESLGGPVTAMILFLMPMYAISKVPAMKKYRNPIMDRFLTIMGLITISAILYGMWGSFGG